MLPDHVAHDSFFGSDDILHDAAGKGTYFRNEHSHCIKPF